MKLCYVDRIRNRVLIRVLLLTIQRWIVIGNFTGKFVIFAIAEGHIPVNLTLFHWFLIQRDVNPFYKKLNKKYKSENLRWVVFIIIGKIFMFSERTIIWSGVLGAASRSHCCWLVGFLKTHYDWNGLDHLVKMTKKGWGNRLPQREQRGPVPFKWRANAPAINDTTGGKAIYVDGGKESGRCSTRKQSWIWVTVAAEPAQTWLYTS